MGFVLGRGNNFTVVIFVFISHFKVHCILKYIIGTMLININVLQCHFRRPHARLMARSPSIKIKKERSSVFTPVTHSVMSKQKGTPIELGQ